MNLKFKIQNSKLQLCVLCSVFCVLCSVFSGCQKPAQVSGDADALRRAQLVGNENIQLKKQLAELQSQQAVKDKQIAELLARLEKSQQQTAELQTRYSELERNMTAALQDCQTALQTQQAEPAAEAVPCEELEARYAQTFETLMQNLLDCSTKLEQYEQETTDSED